MYLTQLRQIIKIQRMFRITYLGPLHIICIQYERPGSFPYGIICIDTKDCVYKPCEAFRVTHLLITYSHFKFLDALHLIFTVSGWQAYIAGTDLSTAEPQISFKCLFRRYLVLLVCDICLIS